MQLKLLNRIATVKDDGTVEFEVPGDVESHAAIIGSDNICSEVDDEPLDDMELRYIPPLQIVMLIVGTRGDVQPFVAIGKRLQVFLSSLNNYARKSCIFSRHYKRLFILLTVSTGSLEVYFLSI